MEERLASEVYKSLSGPQRLTVYNQMLLTEESLFSFRKGDRYIPSSSTDLRFSSSYGVIEQRFLTYEISVSDCFIAYAVAMLGASDMLSVIDYLKWLKRKYPEKIIPATITTAALKERLVKLARAGIVRQFVIANDDSKRGYLFGISEIGARAIKRKLDVEFMAYDTWPLIDCEHRMYKRLIANKVGCALLAYNQEESPRFYSEIYDKAIGQKVPVYVRQEVHYTEDGKEKIALIMVEPVSFVVDKLIKSQSEVIEDERKRLSSIFTRIDLALNPPDDDKKAVKYDEAFVIIAVDDAKGLNKTAEIIYNMSATALDKCLFTTERVLGKHRGKMSRTLFKLRVDESGKMKISVNVDHQAIFGEDEYKGIPLSFADLVKLRMADVADESIENDVRSKYN